ncbi:hypothetical protein [Pseudomonas sp. PSKL.D1]|uniref:hypothetical protein n=1 Tax=Pseudomonas sp. PSKL.D1 TaxID=3029060 RepID=UPI0023811C4E|nr:hypothetical protein [Pseudomonas sp. PSKL.D1]WDY60291.1 hypothetical protein PVV54_11895 [Pseudomonas sp. PSKL.D1]
MMNYSFLDIKKKIEQVDFFEVVVSSVRDWDEALDERDSDDFDVAWTNAFEEMKALSYSSDTDEQSSKCVREFVFKKIYSLTGSAEVSGYISDDIGLVVDAALKSCDSEWVENIFEVYCSGRFPV